MILRRLSACSSPNGRGLMMNPLGLFRSEHGTSSHCTSGWCNKMYAAQNIVVIYRPSLNFIMETTRSSACTLWAVKTRLEWWWTTQVSLCFSSWIDSTYKWVSLLRSCSWFENLKSHTAHLHIWPCVCLFQTPKTKATVFKLCSLCLYLPQDQLTCWGVGDIEDHLRPYMPD